MLWLKVVMMHDDVGNFMLKIKNVNVNNIHVCMLMLMLDVRS